MGTGLGEVRRGDPFRYLIQAGSLPLNTPRRAQNSPSQRGHEDVLRGCPELLVISLQPPSRAPQHKLLLAGKITSGIQPLAFMSNGYTTPPSSVAPFYDSHPWGQFKEKVVHCNKNSYFFFCPCYPFCLGSH